MTQDRIETTTEGSPLCLIKRINQLLESNEDFTLESMQIIQDPNQNNPKFHAFMHLKRRVWGKQN